MKYYNVEKKEVAAFRNELLGVSKQVEELKGKYMYVISDGTKQHLDEITAEFVSLIKRLDITYLSADET